MEWLIASASNYIYYFNKVLFNIFPFAKNFDYQEKIFFCVLLLIALQALAVLFERMAYKISK